MATERSSLELTALNVRAERLVREGYSRADVSRMLGVSAATLAQWALRQGWRKKDLEYEAADRTLQRVAGEVQQGQRAELEKLRGRIRQLAAVGARLDGPGADKLIEAMAGLEAVEAQPEMIYEPAKILDCRQYSDD